MKKLLVIISLFAFVIAANVNTTAVAKTVSADVEYAVVDKDPTKDGKKSSCDDKAKADCSKASAKDCSKASAKSTQGTKGGCCSKAAKASCGDKKGTSTAQAMPEKK